MVAKLRQSLTVVSALALVAAGAWLAPGLDSPARKPAALIPGGEETLDYPAVVRVDDCTGSFLSRRVILTAAHCFVRPEPWSEPADSFRPDRRSRELRVRVDASEIGYVYQGTAEIRFHSIAKNPGLDSRYEELVNSALLAGDVDFDLALVVLPEGAPPAPGTLQLAHEPVRVGQPVKILGFGYHALKKPIAGGERPDWEPVDGRRRIGRNRIANVTTNSILVQGKIGVEGDETFEGNHASAAGDSGGPLLNERDEIVGFVAGFHRTGWLDRIRNERPVGEFLALHEEITLFQRVEAPQVREWIERVLAEVSDERDDRGFTDAPGFPPGND